MNLCSLSFFLFFYQGSALVDPPGASPWTPIKTKPQHASFWMSQFEFTAVSAALRLREPLRRNTKIVLLFDDFRLLQNLFFSFVDPVLRQMCFGSETIIYLLSYEAVNILTSFHLVRLYLILQLCPLVCHITTLAWVVCAFKGKTFASYHCDLTFHFAKKENSFLLRMCHEIDHLEP